VFELVVRARYVHQVPTIGLDFLDKVSAFHENYTHEYTKYFLRVLESLIGQDGWI